VIYELLGLPPADRPNSSRGQAGSRALRAPSGLLRVIPSVFAMKRYMEEQLEAVRENGGEGLIAELVGVEKEGGKISRSEMVAMLFLLLLAGHETTTHLISGSVYELLKNPGLRDWLEEDWSRTDLAVEEFLRFVTPVQFTKPRFVRKDIELGGVRLKKGDKVMPMLAAANMDPQAGVGSRRIPDQVAPSPRHAGDRAVIGSATSVVSRKCRYTRNIERALPLMGP
jgi:cytochrome P450